MKEELIELLRFFRSVFVSDNRTINTISHIDDKMIRHYGDVIEKILSNDVILVDKNKLEHKFKDVPLTLDDNIACVIMQKDFNLSSQIKITNREYNANRKNESFKKYINNMLTAKLLDYFINELKVDEEK